jgi:predicted TIM-barrel fold metal-dependent hydrolase
VRAHGVGPADRAQGVARPAAECGSAREVPPLEEVGASQVVYGTDIPLLWPDAVDNILAAKISDDQKEMILSGNLAKMMKLFARK